jgi:hypothetical protein
MYTISVPDWRASVSIAVTRSPGGMCIGLRSSASANDAKAIEQAMKPAARRIIPFCMFHPFV